MITHSVSPVSYPLYEESSHPAVSAAAELKKQTSASVSRRLVKWFGVFSTALIGALALLPDAFGVPANLQPWLFVTSIFWVLAFCAGMFDL
jgi:hypothetical protein